MSHFADRSSEPKRVRLCITGLPLQADKGIWTSNSEYYCNVLFTKHPYVLNLIASVLDTFPFQTFLEFLQTRRFLQPK